MPIVGMTDKDKPYKKSLCGKVRKGYAKSGNAPGRDLGEKFRVECSTKLVAANLKKVYPDAEIDANGDVLLTSLDVWFAYPDRDKTFDAWMRYWSGSALLRQCDRNSIKFESELRDDRYGNKRHVQIPCDKPCPIKEEPIGVQCPLGCDQEAVISFYVWSPRIREMGINFPLPFELTVTGFTDIDLISTFLDETLEKYDSLKFHSLTDYFGNKTPIGEWGVNLPFVLSRTKVDIKRPVLSNEKYEIAGSSFAKRTGKKADAVAWACLFEPNPEWLMAYEAECDRMENERRMRQQLEYLAEIRAKGLNPGAKGVSLLTGGAIDVEIIEPQALPEAKITKDEWVPVYRSFLDNGWTRDGITNYLADLGYGEPSQIPISKLRSVAASAPDKTQMQHFNNLSF